MALAGKTCAYDTKYSIPTTACLASLFLRGNRLKLDPMTSATPATTGPRFRRVAKVFDLQRARGSKRTFYALLRRVRFLPVVGRCARVYAGDLWQLDLERTAHAQSGPPTRIPQSFQVRKADENDLPALATFHGNEQTIWDRLGRGDLCFMTLCQDRIGAAVWLALGPGECREDWAELQMVQRFPAGIAWSYDGKGTRWGAWAALMRQLPELLRDLGTQKVVTLIDCDNWQSHDAHRSLGYEKTGLIGSVGLFGFQVSACRHANRHWQFLPARIGAIEVQGRTRSSIRESVPVQ